MDCPSASAMLDRSSLAACWPMTASGPAGSAARRCAQLGLRDPGPGGEGDGPNCRAPRAAAARPGGRRQRGAPPGLYAAADRRCQPPGPVPRAVGRTVVISPTARSPSRTLFTSIAACRAACGASPATRWIALRAALARVAAQCRRAVGRLAQSLPVLPDQPGVPGDVGLVGGHARDRAQRGGRQASAGGGSAPLPWVPVKAAFALRPRRSPGGRSVQAAEGLVDRVGEHQRPGDQRRPRVTATAVAARPRRCAGGLFSDMCWHDYSTQLPGAAARRPRWGAPSHRRCARRPGTRFGQRTRRRSRSRGPWRWSGPFIEARRKKCRISAPARPSRLPVGSSAKMICGRLARARATATAAAGRGHLRGPCVSRSPMAVVAIT